MLRTNACDHLFIWWFRIHAEESKRRTLQRSDIAAAISKTDMFDFLIDIVPREELRLGAKEGKTAAVAQHRASSSSGGSDHRRSQEIFPPTIMAGQPPLEGYPYPYMLENGSFAMVSEKKSGTTKICLNLFRRGRRMERIFVLCPAWIPSSFLVSDGNDVSFYCLVRVPEVPRDWILTSSSIRISSFSTCSSSSAMTISSNIIHRAKAHRLQHPWCPLTRSLDLGDRPFATLTMATLSLPLDILQFHCFSQLFFSYTCFFCPLRPPNS